MRRIFITGANRGIGLDLTQRYLAQGDALVFATCRQPERATELQGLVAQHPEQLYILPLDVTNTDAIVQAFTFVREKVDGLDVLYNNAGSYPGGVDDMEPSSAHFGALEMGAMLDVFRVNTVAPAIVAQAGADLLRNGTNARLINVTSDAGSITRRTSGCNYAYPASKAALNMLTRCLAGDFRADGVIVVSVHPGWIQTDMGGKHASLTLDEALPSLMRVVDGLTLADSGEFFNWDGARVAW